MKSIEEIVEDHYKNFFDSIGLKRYSKTEVINSSITRALDTAISKSGGSGGNLPDIKLFLSNSNRRDIPVMIEAKGSKGKLEKKTKAGEIEGVTVRENDSKEGTKNPHKAGDKNYSTVNNYAVNGALHYGLAILDEGTYSEVIIIGVNGTTLDHSGKLMDAECKAYYVSEKNNRVPKEITELRNDLSLLSDSNRDKLFGILDKLNLTVQELDFLTRKAEETLEQKIKAIHQSLYDDSRLKTLLSTNEKLYLFCGLIMSGLSVDGVNPLTMAVFHSNNDTERNDSTLIISQLTALHA